MLCGCLLIALLHPLLPEIDLLLTGLIGGSAGFLLTRPRRQETTRSRWRGDEDSGRGDGE